MEQAVPGYILMVCHSNDVFRMTITPTDLMAKLTLCLAVLRDQKLNNFFDSLEPVTLLELLDPEAHTRARTTESISEKKRYRS